MFVDTHAHLFWQDYGGRVREIVERARSGGVEKIIVPGTDIETSIRAIALADKYPGYIYAGVGIHPEELLKSPTQVEQLRSLILQNRKQVVAIGEIGTDRSTEVLIDKIKDQQTLLAIQCQLALEMSLPVIVHTRASVTEALEVLDKIGTLKAQFHCFSGTDTELNEVLHRGYYASFCGNVSWSKRVRALTKLVPMKQLLLETDSPFMIPLDARGEKVGEINEPVNVGMIAKIVAEERQESSEQVAKGTTLNAERLFEI